jgi:hypothetical protein
MKRRWFLGALGTTGVSLGGCLGRISDRIGPSTTACGESTPPEVRTVTDTTAAPTATSSDAQVREAGARDLLVRHAGHPSSSTARVVTVSITEPVEDDCNPVVFARKYELEPGAEVTVEDPVAEVEEGTYRIDAKLANGNSATRDLYVLADGIPDYAGYTVAVHSGAVEIMMVEV